MVKRTRRIYSLLVLIGVTYKPDIIVKALYQLIIYGPEPSRLSAGIKRKHERLAQIIFSKRNEFQGNYIESPCTSDEKD